ncbi:MAG: sporulation protein YunB [Clostridia bacterium]|nr:sporulation protein YunB [Clostridia bacterium]
MSNKILSRKRKLRFMIVLAILIGITVGMNCKFTPVAQSVATGKAKYIMSDFINSSVVEDMENSGDIYSQITKVERNEKNEISAIYTDMKKINFLKSHIASLIQNKIANFKEKTFWISLGTLSGFEILNGKGPKVPMKISIAGNVFTNFNNKFSNAGINQTIHQIYVNIHTKICITIPGSTCTSESDDEILVSETVIVGKVPRVYSCSGNLDLCKLPES